MVKTVFLSPAKAELTEAIRYYNTQSEGLGYEFAVEVKKTLERIIQYPDAWAVLSSRTRRCRTTRFPYGVVYQVRADTVLVVAIMHMSRNPETWRARLNDNEV